MKKFLLVDLHNMIWRGVHVTKGDAFTRVGLAMHITLNSLLAMQAKFKIDHVVVASEGRSWRNNYYSGYKSSRKVKANTASEMEREIRQCVLEIIPLMEDFFENKTNVTFLKNPSLEADDLISAWILCHDEDQHIVMSSDSDFRQLISENVSIWDGVNEKLYTHLHIFDNDDHIIDDAIDPEYYLFEKIVRGDTSDSVRSAYPGVRKNGSKSRVGIREAFEDRHSEGFNYQSFMNATWTDENDKTIRVKDAFDLNRLLIDLTAQPDDIKIKMAQTVSEAYDKEKKDDIYMHTLKFLHTHELNKLQNNTDDLADILEKHLKDCS